MKRTIVCASIFALSFSVLAKSNSLETRAIQIARETSTQLHLSELDYIRLKNLVELKLKQIEEIGKLYSNDSTLYQQALTEVEKEYQEEILFLLPPKSIPYYLALKPTLTYTSATIVSKK